MTTDTALDVCTRSNKRVATNNLQIWVLMQRLPAAAEHDRYT